MSDHQQPILSPSYQQQQQKSPQQQSSRPPSTPSPQSGRSSNSVVLDSILTQIDRQDDTIKQLQRSAKQHRDTTARHEELIQQQQLLIANLLQQQSSLFTMVSSVNDKQQQQQQLIHAVDLVALSEGSGSSTMCSTSPNGENNGQTTRGTQEQLEQQQVINQLTNKLSLKEQQVSELLLQQASDREAIQIVNQGYAIQSQEIEKLNETIKKLQMDLSICQSELSKAHSKDEVGGIQQVLKLKPVYETLDQQLKRLETSIQTQSRTSIQLIIKTLVGRATIVECDLSDTIAVVKYKISEQTAIPLRDQILLKDGKELNNEATVLSLALLNQTTLHLILKNRGRGQ